MHIQFQRKLAELLLECLLKQTKVMYNEQAMSARSPTVRIDTLEMRVGMFKKLELLILGKGGRWNLPIKQSQPSPVTLLWAPILAGHRVSSSLEVGF